VSIEVFAADEQSALAVDTERWVALARNVLVEEGLRGEVEMSILFVDSVSIAELNQRFLGRSGPTDVLAFPIDEEPPDSGRSPDAGGPRPGWVASEPEELPQLLGDVVICPEVAAANAPGHAGTVDDEMALLVVHGILHLCGYDHEDETEAEAMEARERELLDRHNRPAPAATGEGQD
jgi:probable rRNA maturation factor